MSIQELSAALKVLSLRCAEAEGPDRALDALIWAKVGWTEGGDDDRAWRLNLPRAPECIVNAMDMAQAIERFPEDLAGIAASWNVPMLTESQAEAERMLGKPERPFVWGVMCDFGGLNRAHVFDGLENAVRRDGETMTLALCSAALKALSMRVSQGNGMPMRPDRIAI
jgi:hypothetical protein